MEIHFLVMNKSWKSHGKTLLKKIGHPVVIQIFYKCLFPLFSAADTAAVKLRQHPVLRDRVSEAWLQRSAASNGSAVGKR